MNMQDFARTPGVQVDGAKVRGLISHRVGVIRRQANVPGEPQAWVRWDKSTITTLERLQDLEPVDVTMTFPEVTA